MLLDNKVQVLFKSPAAEPGFRTPPPRLRIITNASLHLLRELIKRDVNARFTGSALGLAWAVLQPLSLLILYWFVFTFMIPGGRLGLPGAFGGNQPYIHFLIAGLLPWLGFNEGLMRSTTAILENAAIVKRLPLRRELLVVVPNVSAMLFECVGLALAIAFILAGGGTARMIWVLPFALLAQFTLQLGIGFMLAATYVFFRDLTQIIGFVLSVVFYLSPILYPVSAQFEKFFFWNPLTALMGLFRSALLSAPLPEPASIVFLLVVAATALAFGMFVFRKVQPTLVDLI
ncbi:MAG TPA: ABC transporter permease [Thermoanaerobaculia bacterium]|nr:ABC transporter permease [Thermoanaerobaculia bacterium]